MTASERASVYLQHIEPSVAGCHGHNQLLYAANVLVNGFALPVEQAKTVLAANFNPRCQPPWPERELDRKLKVALSKGSRRGFGHLLGTGTHIPLETLKPPASSPAAGKWPAPDLDAIDRIARSGPGTYDVWERSPVRFESDTKEEPPHTFEIIDTIFPGDPFLCAGWSAWSFETRRRSAWRGLLSELPLIVPNPMVGPSGQTKEGNSSQHTLQATGHRIYQVVEFDFVPIDHAGRPTTFAPLLEGWKADGISTLDACAALSAHLATLLPSWLLFVYSGGKSGHGWFNVRGLPISAQRDFFRQACRLGADAQLWCRSQFVRVPDGRRENGRRQAALYFDPPHAVTL